MSEDEFNPKEIEKIVAQALKNHEILPFSFIESKLFERLFSLLTHYMPPADVSWVISELRNEFFNGFTKMSPEMLHEIIQRCVKCEAVVRPPVQPSWNKIDPDLMLVAENPTSIGKYDQLLKSSLKDAGFSSQRCMLTYVTRCAINQPDATTIANCLPYLHTEMAVIKPKLIMTLGLGPYAAITGDSTSQLKDVRGSILYFGPYAILPEASLHSGAYTQEKNQSGESYLLGSLKTALTFLYGGKTNK